MEITIRGYSPSKKSRDTIIEKLMAQLEGSPDRVIADAKKNSKKEPGKKQYGLPKASRLAEVGD